MELQEMIDAVAVVVERMAAAELDRLAAEAEQKPKPKRKPAGKAKSSGRSNRHKRGAAAGVEERFLAVTLDVREWAAIVNPIGACSDPLLRRVRDAVTAACKGQRGAVQVGESESAWCRLVSAALKQGDAAGCAAAKLVVIRLSTGWTIGKVDAD